MCEFPYAFFGLTESIDSDLQHVLDVNHVTELFRHGDSILASRVNPSQEEGRASRALELFSTLTREQRRGIYDLYKYDFEIFGYSAVKYMHA